MTRPTYHRADLWHDEEAQIWADLKAANRPDWTRWIDRAVGVLIGGAVVAAGMWAMVL